MLLWIVFGVLTAAVLAVVLRPLLGAGESPVTPGSEAAAIYRDQLREIEVERELGLLGSVEAGAARLEISRRLLRAGDEAGQQGPENQPVISARHPRLALAISLAFPLIVLIAYLANGAPGLPSQPESQRATLRQQIAAVEARLSDHPLDGEGWTVIAPAYARLQRYDEAAKAYTRAIALRGETTGLLAGFVEVSRLANEGRFTLEARRALERMVELEPSRPEFRVWLAMARHETGELEAAEADYIALLASAPPSSAWRPLVDQRLAAVRALRQGEAMVQRLSERLRANGGDIASWQQLIRAYTVLGRKAEAVSALDEARLRFKSEPQSLTALGDYARSLGLGS